MTSQAPELTAVVARLEKVERHLRAEKRRNRWLLAAVGLVLAWTLANTTTTDQAQGANTGPKVIRARQIFLEDEQGNTRVGLGVDKYGPGLVLADEKGNTRVGLTMSKDGPRLVLADEKGKSRAALEVDKYGPRLVLADEKGNTRVGLGVHKHGPALALTDETGKIFWSQP